MTGGGGFIGSRLVARLREAGTPMRLLTRKARADDALCEFRQVDLLDPDAAIDQLFEDVEVFYHCAGELNRHDRMRALHVDATQRLLEAAVRHIGRTGRSLHWVQLSSVGVYGPPPGAPEIFRSVDERAQPAPLGEYEVTKAMSDQLVLDFSARHAGLTCTLLRPSIVIADDMPNQSLRSLVSAVRRGAFFYIGNRDAIATYVHVDDVVDALLLCGVHEAAVGQIFNLSNDCRLSALVDAIRRRAGRTGQVICLPATPLRAVVRLLSGFVPLPLNASRIDALMKQTTYPCTKIQAILGFAPTRAVPDLIADMFPDPS